MHHGAAVADRGRLGGAAERGAGLGGVLGAGVQGKTRRARRGSQLRSPTVARRHRRGSRTAGRCSSAGCPVRRRRRGKTKRQADLFGANMHDY